MYDPNEYNDWEGQGEEPKMNRVELIELLILRGAVKLESLGMKRSRRPSAKTLAIVKLKLGTKATYDEVIAALTKAIEAGEQELRHES